VSSSRRRNHRQNATVCTPRRKHSARSARQTSTVELNASRHEVVDFVGVVGRGGGGRHANGAWVARPR